jgi:hypothetical protein
MIRFIDTSLQLLSIVTPHNQWLPKTRSIPYWTTSVFCGDWPGSDLRIGRFSSFRCPLVNTPQLNTQLPHEWRMPNDKCLVLISAAACTSIISSVYENCWPLVHIHGNCWLLVRIRGNLRRFRWHGKHMLRTKSVSTNPHLHRNVC